MSKDNNPALMSDEQALKFAIAVLNESMDSATDDDEKAETAVAISILESMREAFISFDVTNFQEQ